MPVEWIGVRCAECRTYQCIQRPKPKGKRHPSSRFSCRLCSHQQTLLTIFAVSYNASDVREGLCAVPVFSPLSGRPQSGDGTDSSCLHPVSVAVCSRPAEERSTAG